LKQLGVTVVELAQKGINLVVVRAEIDYLWPLRSGDAFGVSVRLERVSRLRFAFLQDIDRAPDHKPILKAKIIGTSLDAKGRPKLFPEIEALLTQERADSKGLKNLQEDDSE
jgi:acyl-CoA thioester hydrolase